MTIKTYATVTGLAALTAVVVIAVNTPEIVVAVKVALFALLAAGALAGVLAIVYALVWFQTKIQKLRIGVQTAAGQSVAIHNGGDGTVYAINPLRLPVDSLHLLPPAQSGPAEAVDRWLTWTLRRRPTGQIIDLPADAATYELSAPAVPDVVRLEDAISYDDVSINRLYLGAGPGGEPVYGRLKDLSHIAIGGTSRWGKSTLEQSLLYQLVIAREEIDFYLSDVGGTAFLSFGIPYADSPTLSEKLVAKVYSIFEDRKAGFKAAGQQVRTGVRSLDIYNQITGDSLPVIVLAMDEVTALMADSKQMSHQINSLILQAGKYGIFLILSGQNWTARNIGTTTRDQFSSRFQMKAMDRYQANILISNSGAEQFTTKGRASVLLPGAIAPVQIQTPLIDEETISLATQRRPRSVDDLQWIVADEAEAEADSPADGFDQDRAATIRKLHADGLSKTEIAKYFGYKANSGSIFYEIKAALEDE
jgi:DNA segregation ATPase FtsK/SpoIIIE-like protein